MTATQSGTLYGIGVGPGDPDLLTLRAVKVLGGGATVFAASSSKNDYSIAEAIIRPHLPAGTEVTRLPFPMTRDADALEERGRRREVPTIEAMLRARHAQQGVPGRRRAFGDGRAVLRHVPRVACRAAEGVVVAGGVLRDCREDAPVSGEERMSLAEVGLPRDLLGVGDVEPLCGVERAEQDDRGRRVALRVLQADAGASSDAKVRVPAGRDRLRPQEIAWSSPT